MTTDFLQSLKSKFGFTSFRPGQAEAIQSLADGQNTLVVMPTGSGKSLIYQLTSLQIAGITLVISPLIALMKDQVDSLERRGIQSTFINSALPSGEQIRRLKLMGAGKYQLVYVAPERLRSVQFREALRLQKVGLLAVDEAHCISGWGHDFRPDYLRISNFRVDLGNPLTVALTATATPQVQDDIVKLLNLGQARRIVTGFNRPNLAFEVRYMSDVSTRLQVIQKLLQDQQNGATIIYTGTRRDAEEVAEFVQTVTGVKAEYYHAGMPPEERTRIQESFMEGKLPVVAATNAFGMGIDRPDVRLVIHYSVPGTLEAYYQEAGRAGRDGLPSRAVLLYSPEDRALQEWFIENSVISVKDLRLLFDVLRLINEQREMVTMESLSRQSGLPDIKLRVCLSTLERAEAVERLGDEGLRVLVRTGEWKESRIQAACTEYMQHQRHREAQLQKMIVYAESNQCRRSILLKHFGDPGPAEALDCCDNCRSRQTRKAPITTQPAKTGPADLSPSDRTALAILDAVRRLERPVGRDKLAQILKGSRAREIMHFGYDRNVYYRRLEAYSATDIKGMIEQLLTRGFLKVVGGEFPVLKLTPQAEEALRNKTSIDLRLPRRIFPAKVEAKRAEREAGGTVEYTAQLFERGLDPAQIASQRGQDVRTTYNHLAKLISSGRIEISRVVPDEVRKKIEAAIQEVGSVAYLTPIKNLLPEEIDYGVIRCVVEWWKLNQSMTKVGRLKEDEKGDISLVENHRSISRDHPSKNSLSEKIGQTSSNRAEDAVRNFLSQPHPRPLTGPWTIGWALSFHSRFSGSEWNRSEIGELAYRLKYQGDLSTIPDLVEQAAALIVGRPEYGQIEAVVPVPCSTPRPHDPLTSFVKVLSQRLGMEFLPILGKTRQTAPQKELRTLAQKRANVAGAFYLAASIKGKRLLLVDDLYDTGATLEEITRLLLSAGAGRVCVLTLTRTIHSDA